MIGWPKKITVDKRIVKLLSQSTYESFPHALKEIITNSYDADASISEINISLKDEVITLRDNGMGMSESDFDLYIRIAGYERKKSFKTPSGRNRIGQFGIGFLSIFPFVKNFYIESKTKGSDQLLFAQIPCYKYFSGSNIVNVDDIKISGGLKIDNTNFSESYTYVKLSGFTELTKAFFYPKKEVGVKPRINSIAKYNPLKKLKWILSEDLPISYEQKKFENIFQKFSPNLKFKVLINNENIYRQIYGKEILESQIENEIQLGRIKFHYFIVSDRKAVIPFEARALKLRNLNIGVGKRETFGLGTEVGGARSRLQWLSGEIIVTEGLNELITISRDSFNYSPDFERLKQFFIKKLAHFSTKLEKDAEFSKYISESIEDSKIKNIKLLDPVNISKQLEKLSYSDSNPAPEFFTKKILIKKKKFNVVLSEWDYKLDFQPACKIVKNDLIINKVYPLFAKPKYTDIFIKMHLILLTNYEDGTLTKNSFIKLSNDILDFYKEYIN